MIVVPPVDTRVEVSLSLLCTRILKKRLSVLRSGETLVEEWEGYEVRGRWVDKKFVMEVGKK